MPRFIIVNDRTIRESREYEDPRPRKRQRVLFEQDDDSDKDTLTDYFTSESTKPELLVRDPEYYLDDPKADCFVRVEKTLFKVSLSLYGATVHCLPGLRRSINMYWRRPKS